MNTHSTPPPRLGVGLAFAAVYLVWGSTYLAIRYAIETIPPFLMAGGRFLIAGGLLYAWSRRGEGQRPRGVQWRNAAITGGLLFMGANGMVTWAEQSVPSGSAALFVATVPLWMVLLEWGFFQGNRPSGMAVLGLLVGSAGVALLVGSGTSDHGRASWVGGAALLFSCVCWSTGSLFSRGADRPRSMLLAASMQMLMGGLGLLLVGTLAGEWSRFQLEEVSLRSALSVLYLCLFGSIVAFTAYAWLLQVCSAVQVATYAYVNPVVAVFLGCVVGGEPFEMRMVVSTALIAVAIGLVTISRRTTPPGMKSTPASRTPAPSSLEIQMAVNAQEARA